MLFLITHVTSVTALVLYAPVLSRSDYIVGDARDTRVLLGALLVGPSLVLGTSTVLLAYLLYRSGLAPRFIPVLGLVFASGTAQMFGLYEQISVWATVTSVPVFASHPIAVEQPDRTTSDILCGDVGDR